MRPIIELGGCVFAAVLKEPHMDSDSAAQQIRTVGDGSGLDITGRFSAEEVQLALRNRGLPLEALRYPLTPTSLHYLLVHYDIPEVDAGAWRLRLGGQVAKPLSLSLDDLRGRPAQSLAVTMECAGNGRGQMTPRRINHPWMGEAIGTADWTGTPLRGLLEEAGLRPEAVELVFTGLDRGIEARQVQAYQRSLSREEASRPEVLLAYAMNGEPLPPQHGYPLRLIVPGWYGMTSVKWLDRIEALAEPFQGFQMTHAYRYAQSADWVGEPVSLIKVRALMAPPGIPDFMTRTRLVPAGPVTLRGTAWAGRSRVTRVEVSADGGQTWAEAEVGEPLSDFAWAAWRFAWDARPGPATLCVRATDAAGNVQPLEPDWNYGGYGNNAVQRVSVIVA
jgi:DMSO/TMAO reductase YedYZ molybdopterin-dependent catalytic subunit